MISPFLPLDSATLASKSTLFSALFAVPAMEIPKVLPSLAVLDHALLASGLATAAQDPFGDTLLRVETQCSRPAPEGLGEDLRRDYLELVRLLTGKLEAVPEPSDEWEIFRSAAMTRWGQITDRRRQLKPTTLSLPPAIARHPLAKIVGEDYERGGLHIRVELVFDSPRTEVGKLSPKGPRILIPLSTRSEQTNPFGNGDKALRTLIAKTVGWGGERWQKVIIVAGASKRERKAFMIPGISILEILDALNNAGPKLASWKKIRELIMVLAEREEKLLRRRNLLANAQRSLRRIPKSLKDSPTDLYRQMKEAVDLAERELETGRRALEPKRPKQRKILKALERLHQPSFDEIAFTQWVTAFQAMPGVVLGDLRHLRKTIRQTIEEMRSHLRGLETQSRSLGSPDLEVEKRLLNLQESLEHFERRHEKIRAALQNPPEELTFELSLELQLGGTDSPQRLATFRMEVELLEATMASHLAREEGTEIPPPIALPKNLGADTYRQVRALLQILAPFVRGGGNRPIPATGEKTAEPGMTVIAERGSRVTAQAGSIVFAKAGSEVWAGAGSIVHAGKGSRVTPKKDSLIFGHDHEIPETDGAVIIRQSDTHGERGEFVPEEGEVIAPINALFREINTTFWRVQRLIGVSFGDEARYWPSKIARFRQTLEDLHRDYHQQIHRARHILQEAEKEIAENADARGIQHLLLTGINLLWNFLGALPDRMSGQLPKKFLSPQRHKPFRERWQHTLSDILELIEKEGRRLKEFELTPEILEGLLDTRTAKPSGWRSELDYLETRAMTVKAALPTDQWSGEMTNLHTPLLGGIAAGREAISHFADAVDALKAEWEKGDDANDRELYRLHEIATTLLKKIRATVTHGQEKLEALEELAEQARMGLPKPEPISNIYVPDRNRRPPPGGKMPNDGIPWADEYGNIATGGFVEGVPVVLKGKAETREKKLGDIASLLILPPNELAASETLAFPLFRDEVKRRLDRGQNLRELKAYSEEYGAAIIWDARFGTVFYVPVHGGWVIPEAAAMLMMLHGGGGGRSTGITMLAPAIRFRNAFRFNALSFDTPNHGWAIRDERFHDLGEMTDWVASMLRYFKFLASDENGRQQMPVVAVGRSHGENMLEQMAITYPGLADGIVGISGYDPAWTPATMPHLLERIQSGDFDPHPEGLPMVFAHEGLETAVVKEGGRKKLRFGEEVRPNQWRFLDLKWDGTRRKTPSLILSGTKDDDYSQGVPDFYLQRDRRARRLGFPHVIVDGGPHDLLRIDEKRLREKREDVELVYDAIGRFVTELPFEPPAATPPPSAPPPPEEEKD